MSSQIAWRLERNPSALANLFRAFFTFGRSRRRAPPVHEATLLDVEPDPRKIASFLSVCGSPPRDDLHLLYPFALCYPLVMRILSSRAMPFSMTRVLNTRNVIVQTRPILASEGLSLRCRNTPWRVAPKGRELDLTLDVASSGQQVWSCTATYLVRGAQISESDSGAPAKRLDPLADPDTLASWRLEPRDRLRFAKVSGDTNGIHYWSWYAKRFGFERDFAQPLRVVTRCVDLLPSIASQWPRRLEFHLKGPVYYARNLTLRGASRGDHYRFDLHCAEDQRPCITGQMGPDCAGRASPAASI